VGDGGESLLGAHDGLLGLLAVCESFGHARLAVLRRLGDRLRKQT
jgi:hypothetical protein